MVKYTFAFYMNKAATNYLLIVFIFLLKNIQPAEALALPEQYLLGVQSSAQVNCDIEYYSFDDISQPNVKKLFLFEEIEIGDDDDKPLNKKYLQISFSYHLNKEFVTHLKKLDFIFSTIAIHSYEGNILLNGRLLYLFTKVLRL